ERTEGPVVLPKDSRKKWIYVANAMVFLVAIIYFAVLSILLPKPTTSEVERRDLAKAPHFTAESYFSKGYTQKLDTFYADTFPGREGFIKISYAINEAKGIAGEVKLYKAEMHEVQNDLPAPTPTPTPTPEAPAVTPPESQSGTPTPTPEPTQEPVVEPEVVDDNAYMNNNIFIYQNAAYQMFFGEHSSAENYAKIVSSYAAELPGVNVYTQVIPQPYNFYLPQKYKKMGKDEKEYASFLHSKLTDGAKGIKAYEKLEENKDEYIYFRTDTHWTGRGAYCAYEAFCEAAGFTPVPLSDMETRRVEGDFLGYLYTLTMDKNLAATPDYVEYYIVPGVTKVEAIIDRAGAQELTTLPSLWAEDRKGGNAYTVFIYGDLPYMKVTTSVGTGRQALLIKDSYGNAFAPFLMSHYDTVHILDERHYPYSVYELIEQQGIDDVIISNSSYSANAASHQQNLITLKKGRNGSPPDFEAIAKAKAERKAAENKPQEQPAPTPPLPESESSAE
ncbi:MAG: DHHW family protein, partial [Angelakisella sp.]